MACSVWVGASISLVGAIIAFFIFEPTESIAKEPIKLRELIAIMREPSLLVISLLSILAHSIIFTTMFGFIPTYALHIGLQATDISFVVLAFMIPHAVATLFIKGKYVVPLFGKWKSLQVAFLLRVVRLLLHFCETKWLFVVVQGSTDLRLELRFPYY